MPLASDIPIPVHNNVQIESDNVGKRLSLELGKTRVASSSPKDDGRYRLELALNRTTLIES